MREDYEELFTDIDQKEPPPGLLELIMLRIGEERRRAARIRIMCLGAVSLIALFSLVPAWQGFYAELAQSGFTQFMSLLFSDAGVVASYWQEFVMSLAESFPMFGLFAVLASVFALLLPLRFLARDMSAIFHRSKIATI